MKWEGLGMQQCAPAPHHAAVVPLALAAEAEGAEVGAEAAVMEGQEKSLSEAEICRELPQELPRAVQEQQEHGGLGGIRDGVASPPPKQGPNSCHPAGMGMGGSHLLSRGVPAEQPQPVREGVSSCHPLPLHQALEARQGAGVGVPQELHQRGQEAVQVPVRGLWGGKVVRGVPFPAHSIPLHPPSQCPHLAGPRSSASLPAATPPP